MTCSRCHRPDLTVEDFHRCSSRASGRQAYCKRCWIRYPRRQLAAERYARTWIVTRGHAPRYRLDVLAWLGAVRWTVHRSRVRPQPGGLDRADACSVGLVALLECRRRGIVRRGAVLDAIRLAVRRAVRAESNLPVALDLDSLVSGHERLLLRDTIAEDRRRR